MIGDWLVPFIALQHLRFGFRATESSFGVR